MNALMRIQIKVLMILLVTGAVLVGVLMPVESLLLLCKWT